MQKIKLFLFYKLSNNYYKQKIYFYKQNANQVKVFVNELHNYISV
jgi:hypothetical protein